MANTTKKHPGGRPRKTIQNCLPENWKDIILEMSAKGCSHVEIRAHLCLMGGKFSHETWYALKDREQEFSDTIKIAGVLCQAWWERMGRNNITAQYFQTGLWYANMKNRFGWRDQQPEKSDEEIKERELEFVGMPKGEVNGRYKRFYN